MGRTKDAWFRPLTRMFLNNRFDDETKEVFKDLYTKIDADVDTDTETTVDYSMNSENLDTTPF